MSLLPGEFTAATPSVASGELDSLRDKWADYWTTEGPKGLAGKTMLGSPGVGDLQGESVPFARNRGKLSKKYTMEWHETLQIRELRDVHWNS